MDQNTNTNENTNTNAAPATHHDSGERTFTQEEVNRIISDRLGRERDKRAAELDERENAIKARELAVLAAEKLEKAGLSKGLSDVLKYEDEKTLDAAIEKLTKARGFTKEPQRHIIENKLPEMAGNTGDPVDVLRDAFHSDGMRGNPERRPF